MGNFTQNVAGAGLRTAAAADPEPISKIFLTLAATVEQLFHIGPNPYNVPAAQLEQAFEAASDNIQYLYKAGLVTDAQRQQANIALIQLGSQYFNQYIATFQQQGPVSAVKPFSDGAANMVRTIQAETAGKPPVNPTGDTLSVSTAQKYYIPVTQTGWYPGSLQKAAQLTDSLVEDLSGNPIAQISGVAGGIGQEVLDLFSGAGTSYQTQTQAPSSNAKYVGWGVIGVIAAKLLHLI